ncbi:MAG TPA: sulfite exporter TauE/SafE family protein [Saprospiraceae bacterium]|nr:sulfite exporter TauE/SafE family protein [Saprospiraceae bacterium]
MELIFIALVSCLASILTFYSGFGLGTILLPVFGLFFSIELAIAMTAIVHFLNNAFKFLLTRKHMDTALVWKFGMVSLLFALPGAWLLREFSGLEMHLNYTVWGWTADWTPLKALIGFLLMVFVWLEFTDRLKQLDASRPYLYWIAAGSGFFGGLSGHQGALRSAFLGKLGLRKESFIATGIAIACMVDLGRLAVYQDHLRDANSKLDWMPVAVATAAAFSGAWLGSRYLHKIRHDQLHRLVYISLFAFGLALLAGWI